MDRKAVEAARIEFDHARQNLDEMKASNTYPEVRRHWAAFLVSTGRVFTKLEQGAKSNSKSIAWFGRIKHRRRTDQLLSYVWHARNADEHGIEAVTELHPGSSKFVDPTPEEQAAFKRQMEKEGKPYTVLGLMEVVFPHVRLVDVPTRDGQKIYSPPRPEPLNVGMLALAFVDNMIQEAESLVV